MPRKLPIFYSALLLTGVNLLLRFVSTSFQVYISGKIGAAGVGLLQLVLSVGSLALVVGVAGIRTTTMYLSAEALGKKNPAQIRPILSGCFLYSILCSSTVALILYAAAPFLAEFWIGNPHTLSAIRLYAAFLPVNCLCGVMTGYFTAANRIGTLAAVEVVEQLVSMAVTTTLLINWAGHNAAKACQCIILGNGISMCLTLCCLVFLRLKEPAVNGPRLPVRKPLLNTAVPLALADNLKVGISTTENLMVPKRLALYPGVADPLAAFGLVCGMVFPVIMFPAAILYALAELLIPELARCAAAESKQRIQYLSARSLRTAVLYGCCFGAMEFLLAKELCLWLYKTDEAAVYMRLYALLVPMLYCDAITDAMIKGLGQQKASVRYNILTSAMDVVGLFFLLPVYGMGGYYFSFLITHLINFLLSIRRLFKITGKAIPLRLPMLALAGTVAAVGIVYHVGTPLLRIGSFVICYLSILFLLRVLQEEDILWLRGLVKRKSGS